MPEREQRPSLKRLLLAFVAARDGVALLEFALVLPLLALMLFGSVDAGRALAINGKVRAVASQTALMTAHSTLLYQADIDELLGAADLMFAPYAGKGETITVSQISIANNGRATIMWSASSGGTPRTQGSTISVPTNLVTPSSYLILAEVAYPFTPIGPFVPAINLTDIEWIAPLNQNCVNNVPENVTACV